jgi:hypothetical protein
VDTDINLFLVEDYARRFSRAPAARPEGPATQEGGIRLIEADPDESFVEDQREALRPAQHVERKLVAMLESSPVLVSQLQKVNRPNARS